MDDDQTQNTPTPPPEASEPATVVAEPDSAQPTGSDTANTPPIAPESPTNAPAQ